MREGQGPVKENPSMICDRPLRVPVYPDALALSVLLVAGSASACPCRRQRLLSSLLGKALLWPSSLLLVGG